MGKLNANYYRLGHHLPEMPSKPQAGVTRRYRLGCTVRTPGVSISRSIGRSDHALDLIVETLAVALIAPAGLPDPAGPGCCAALRPGKPVTRGAADGYGR